MVASELADVKTQRFQELEGEIAELRTLVQNTAGSIWGWGG